MSEMTHSVFGPSRSSMPMTFGRSSGFGTHSPCLLRHGHPASDLHAAPLLKQSSSRGARPLQIGPHPPRDHDIYVIAARLSRGTANLVSDEQRNRRLMKESVSRAAQQPLAHAGMTVSTHDNKVGFQAPGLGDQSGADIVVAHPGAMHGGIDPVMLEVLDRVDSKRCVELYRPLIIDDQDRPLLRLLQIWERLRQRAGCFPAAVPCKNDALEYHLFRLAAWHQKEMSARTEKNGLDQVLGLVRRAIRPQCHERVRCARPSC